MDQVPPITAPEPVISATPVPTPKSPILPIIIAVLVTAIIFVGGYFGYHYLNTSKQIIPDSNCFAEGGSIPVIPNPPTCCPGTTLINPQDPNLVGSHGFCTSKCGDNTCDSKTESNYNCPSDCKIIPTSSPTNTSLDTVPSDWKTYTNTRYGYQLQYPKNFTLLEEDGPSNSQLFPNQKLQQVTLSNNSSSLKIFYEGEFDHGFDPWELDKRESLTIGNKPAIKTILTSFNSDGLWIIYTIENFHSFRIEATADKDNAPIIDQILSTFKFEDSNSQKQLGYIKSVVENQGQYSLTIDYIDMISDENQPNGFRISNTNPKLRTFVISPNVAVVMQTYSHTPDGNFTFNQSIPLQTLVSIFTSSTNTPHLKEAPYWITLQNNQVATITEQYLP